ncbi:hypothetical protein LCGC14_0976220 [marine sediment metagenome]|uniref:Uncharacterized protein n=1 Tax=marine sediment metagenome TaxID=412755 RepID=A0A0F9NEN6_9ZZZZ
MSFLTGFQERNQRNLLDIFSAAKPVMEEIAKVKPETWRNMSGLFKALEGTFGVGQIGAGFTKPLSMLQNRASNVLEGALAPIMIEINKVSNQVEVAALANRQGATIGAVIGFVAGYVLPGSPLLWSMIGGALGTFIQAGITDDHPLAGGGGIVPYPGAGGGNGDIQVAATGGPIVPLPFVRPPRAQMLEDLNRTRPGRQRGFAQFG